MAGIRCVPQWRLQVTRLNLRKAIDTYDDLMKREGYNEDLHVYKSCCLFALCKYDEAKEECEKGKDSDLKVRSFSHNRAVFCFTWHTNDLTRMR